MLPREVKTMRTNKAEQNIDRMAIIEDTIQDNTRKMIKECNSEIEDS